MIFGIVCVIVGYNHVFESDNMWRKNRATNNDGISSHLM